MVMKSINEYIDELKNGLHNDRLREVYVDDKLIQYNVDRYINSLCKFKELFGDKDVSIYSAPGRSEVSGNHTDHQHGHVLATSINLDAIAVVAYCEDDYIHLVSGDMPQIDIDLHNIELVEEEKESTLALVKGVLKGLHNQKAKLGGFYAYITSDVLMGAGMSSSAAFESLIGTIISGLYNDMQISSVDIAKIGQYAENVYFGKPCGLMDQMACSVGGLIYIDFENINNPIIKKIPVDFEKNEYSLCIVDTKGSHADLTEDYAAVPAEMKAVAKIFGKEYLREVQKEEFFSNLKAVRERTNDRAVLRAIHFFTEQERVVNAINALSKDDFSTFLGEIRKSGDSSYKYLQNIYSNKSPLIQNVSLALSVSECLLGDNGVCRVHGGGFAGTIQAFVKNSAVEDYKEKIEAVFGKDSCHILKIRPFGGICVM